MRKLIFGMVAGVILTLALFTTFLGPFWSTPVTGEPGTADVTETYSSNTTYRENIYLILQKANDEIKDDDTLQFYRKLMQAYELDGPSGATEGEEPTPADILPNFNKINSAALYLPLQEVGRNIQDKELAEFYRKLLTSAGWPIEPQ